MSTNPRTKLLTILSDDNGLQSRLSTLVRFKQFGCKLIKSKISSQAVDMFDKIFNMEMETYLRQTLLSYFEIVTFSNDSNMNFSEKLVEASYCVSQSIINKEKLNISHLNLFLTKIKDFTNVDSIHTNLSDEQCFQRYKDLKKIWSCIENDSIPAIPILEDNTIRIAGCAGTKRLCDTLDRLKNQLKSHDFEKTPINAIYIGRHGLSTKTYGKEWNGRSGLFKTGDVSNIPDFGHNVKIYGERGQEARYFSLLKDIKIICQSKGIIFDHFTTNSFYTSEDGSGVPGTRLTCLRLTNEGIMLDYYGDINGSFPRGTAPVSVPINVDIKLMNILTTLCFTKNATFMHDLKLCWALANYEKVKHLFTIKECELWSGGSSEGSNDMLFHHLSEHDIVGYRKAITSSMVMGVDKFPPTLVEINHQLNHINKSRTIILDKFITKYEDSWNFTQMFHGDLSKGIVDLKVSAMVTDPGPGHIKKAHDGYFPLGPQDGDDLMAICAILHPNGVMGTVIDKSIELNN